LEAEVIINELTEGVVYHAGAVNPEVTPKSFGSSVLFFLYFFRRFIPAKSAGCAGGNQVFRREVRRQAECSAESDRDRRLPFEFQKDRRTVEEIGWGPVKEESACVEDENTVCKGDGGRPYRRGGL
jgi:hypothetical protein